jgi:crossover junction endodeoxyribonuclease RuvC
MNFIKSKAVSLDPGNHGAGAVFLDGELIDVFDIPTLADGVRGRATINGPLLASIIYKTQAERAFCELIGPRPTDGVGGAFSFGRARGLIEGICAAAGIPLTFVAPVTWKRHCGVAPGKAAKDSARSVAISKWPAKADLFARKKDIDRAEAALIGLTGITREAGR